MTRPTLVILSLLCMTAASVPAGLDAWCAHVTNAGGWKTDISLLNSGTTTVTCTLMRYNPGGTDFGPAITVNATPKTWVSVNPAFLAYNGTAHLTAPQDLDVKLTYQFGESPSVCEFFLAGARSMGWMLPNTVRTWMNWTGVALMNPGDTTITVTLEAWLAGNPLSIVHVDVPARSQYVRLSNLIWSGLAYNAFDTIFIRSNAPLPPPIDITGNDAGDRNLFFSGRPHSMGPQAGSLVEADPILGITRYIPPGLFLQGSRSTEPCRDDDESPQFAHILTGHLAMMETEVTRQMWADLKAAQPELPSDPTATAFGSGMNCPVQHVTWYEAVLFANLASVQRGLTRCYWADAGFTVPITAANHLDGSVFCNWNASGYRLPTEGEWEYACRAGTNAPFWITEPNYSPGNCGSTAFGLYPQLETVAWFNANSLNVTHPVGTKGANPWNLADMHGNVNEWCWDPYGAYPFSGVVTDYRGATGSTSPVFRGGDVFWLAGEGRSARRHPSPPNLRLMVGLRLVRGM